MRIRHQAHRAARRREPAQANRAHSAQDARRRDIDGMPRWNRVARRDLRAAVRASLASICAACPSGLRRLLRANAFASRTWCDRLCFSRHELAHRLSTCLLWPIPPASKATQRRPDRIRVAQAWPLRAWACLLRVQLDRACRSCDEISTTHSLRASSMPNWTLNGDDRKGHGNILRY